MKPRQKDITRTALASGLLAGIVLAFSVPLGIIPAIGTLFNPFGGLWNIDHVDPATRHVSIPGMAGQVTVIRDPHGIPHIYGQHEIDVVRAFGYMHAKDRLFQLEMTRRQISGLLAEVAGPSLAATDAYFRTLRLKSAADNLTGYTQLHHPALYQMAQAYVDGINQYIDTASTLPVEFHLLGVRPTRWTVADSIALEKIMDYDLTFNEVDLLRTRVNETLGSAYPTVMDELYPVRTPFQVPVSPAYGAHPDQPSPSAPSSPVVHAIDNVLARIRDAHESDAYKIDRFSWIGSNNWVVNASRSATGAPILCNDMHLGWTLPCIWYQAHLVAIDTGMNVQGFSLVGTPLIIVGHNENVAWGMTNVGADHVDWYVYEANDTHYWYEPDMEYKRFGRIVESIPVKGGAPVELVIKTTVHGPVLSTTGAGKPIAFRWVANTLNTTTFLALYGFNHASNLTEFNDALQYFTLPSQNIVYADRFGNIAIRATGAVPFRDGVDNTSLACSYLLNGSAGVHEWNGTYIPFEQMPHAINPAEGYLVSANQLSAGPAYPHYYRASMANSYRARRIHQLLAGSPQVSVLDMTRIQLDAYDIAASWFVPLVLDAYDNASLFPAGQKTAVLNQSMDLLRAWNSTGNVDRYQMRKELAAPAIFSAIFEAFKNGTLLDEWAPHLAAFGGRAILPADNVFENLSLHHPGSPWFDDVDTPGTTETRDDILKGAIVQGVSYLASLGEFSGTAPTSWRWGAIHKVYFNHLAGLSPFSRGPYEADGSSNTVSPTFGGFRSVARGGASERLIIDFSQADNHFSTSHVVMPGGASGNPVSWHYADELELFLAGAYHPLYYYPTSASFPDALETGRITFSGGA